MIKVQLFKKGQQVYGFEVTGHANYLPKGQDLVCAGVSSIITGGFNALEQSAVEEIILEEGKAVVSVKENHHENMLVIKTMVIQLMTIAETYPKYIKII